MKPGTGRPIATVRRAWVHGKSVSAHVIKNVSLEIPGVMQVRKTMLGSRFGRGDQSGDTWQSRRVGQLGELLEAYRVAWADWEWLKDKRVLELGSGVDCSMPYAFCLLGASAGYASDVDAGASFALPDGSIGLNQEKVSAYVPRQSLTDHSVAVEKLQSCPGVSAEKLAAHFGPGTVDLIVSTSTLEHVDDPARALDQMAQILARDGRMIHAIAMGNHCCGPGDSDRLAHLYYPEWLWSAMFSNRVGHNRLRWFEWERLLAEAGFSTNVVKLVAASRDEVEASRPFLAPRFRHLTADKLAPSYAVVCCTKH